MASALALLGTERALVVHGAEGLDEISLSGPTYLLDVSAGGTSESVIRPEQLGLKTASAEALLGGDAAENATIVRNVLSGNGEATEAQRDMVALNAAAALVAAGAASDLRAGLERAREVMRSGAALRALERFVATSQELGN
jgi:anthranilate phosphoribosyltransferase